MRQWEAVSEQRVSDSAEGVKWNRNSLQMMLGNSEHGSKSKIFLGPTGLEKKNLCRIRFHYKLQDAYASTVLSACQHGLSCNLIGWLEPQYLLGSEIGFIVRVPGTSLICRDTFWGNNNYYKSGLLNLARSQRYFELQEIIIIRGKLSETETHACSIELTLFCWKVN